MNAHRILLIMLGTTGLAAAQPVSPITRLCARTTECGCATADCEATLAGFPEAVATCFAAQPCEVLCGPNGGEPGSPLHAACLAGPAEPAAPATQAAAPPSPTARLCARDAECGCPVPDCEAFFATKNLSEAVISCFAAQPCEALCGPKSGAVGSLLHTACLAGADPVRKACQTDAQCAPQHDCCGGLCYKMGTPLWQTQCMMPSGKF